MDRWFTYSSVSTIANGFLVSTLVVIGTFPANEWTYSIGVDPPLAWVFDYLSKQDSALGRHIIFPHGPMAYFMYPLDNNIGISVLVSTGLKLLLIQSLFSLCRLLNYTYPWLITLVVAYAFCMVIEFNQLLLINIVLLYNLYFLRPNSFYAFAGFLLTALAFYVKANVAVWSGLIFCAFNTYQLFYSGNVKKVVLNAGIMIALIVLFWLGMYQTITGFFDHIIGELNLIQDNSSAAALYPDNNWWQLVGVLAAVVLLILLNSNKAAHFYWLLTGLNFFAMWKYAMSREDMFHIKEMFIFLFTHLSIFVLFNHKRLYVNSVLAAVALLLFNANMRNAFNYIPLKYELVRVNNFIDFATNLPGLKRYSCENNALMTARKKLPKALLDSIGNATVDVYPYDYSILAFNKLNWRPRVVLHSYASYTNWLDKRNAHHFDSSNAPEFVIVEHVNYYNVNNSDYGSVDNRYYLNDEPSTILEILKDYDFINTDGNYLLLKKRIIPTQFSQQEIGRIATGWRQWIPVPDSLNDLLRAKITFDKSLLGALKSLAYKDEQFWVYMLLNNGLIHKYRIVPKNAATGLWINPYIYTVNEAYKIKKIMFVSSSQYVVADELTVTWERIRYANQPDRPLAFFGLKKTVNDSLLFRQNNDFEQLTDRCWQPVSAGQLTDPAFTGKQSLRVKSESFSPQFSLSLDSISADTLRVVADCWINAPQYMTNGKLLMVVRAEGAAGVVAEKVIPVDDQLIDPTLWSNVSVTLPKLTAARGTTLKTYLWNTSKQSILVDDFRVTVLKPAKSD